MGNRLLRAALKYAELGWHVFPCAGKIPAIPGAGGFRHATNDTGKINEWWSGRYRQCNIGVWPRPSGLIVLDIDRKRPDQDGLERLNELESYLGKLPHTPTQLTPSGGLHMFYRAPGVELDKHPFESPYLELFTDNHVCLAPSRIGEKKYEWDSGAHILETSLADLPKEWIDYAHDRTPHCKRHNDGRAMEHTAPIESSLLWTLFNALGAPVRKVSETKAYVCCPWADDHSTGTGAGRDSSAVILAPVYDGHPGSFCCQHAHCRHKGVADIATMLSDETISKMAWANPAHARSIALIRSPRWHKKSR